ncbi:MAG TPA: magnesium transporter [Sedimentibacter sp.]|jgi:magnesium transporter|nr:magnesium transporter [Sedimentibacter sp.]NLA13525.1 magnesium transporter [Tissierellia bacterium]HAS91936.1 magnesium transporter [Clostridiales bacterium]HOA18959.1 magnesium transporter [Sedimentibacter sp.]HPB79047.1 magnesium transporter [Sedimentibacter sp.]
MEKLDILELIEQKKYIQLKKELSEMNEVDISEILDPLDLQTTLLVFRMLPKDTAAEVFSYISPEQKADIINAVTDKELKYILDELFFDDMIDLIEEMPANVVNKILINSTQEERTLINQFLKYPAHSAGSIMTIEYVELKKNMTVKEALEHIKKTGINKETIYTCYVTDKKRKLEGIVSLRNLVVSDPDQSINDIMQEEVIYVETHDDQEIIANIFKKYGFMALPVVDKEHRLIGIITFDDIMDVMEDEATEDFQRMAAMVPSDEAYLDLSVIALAKQRIPWLMILMLGATVTGGIITKFENILSTVVVLTAFIPMLMDTGGNSGNQSSTLIIRGLALGNVNQKDIWKVLWKEFRISLLVGIILASVNFAKNMLFDKVGLNVSLTVSLTVATTVMLAKMVGGTLPLIAKKLKLDPAIMAGPLITTIVDALVLLVYFGVASALLIK